MSHRAFTDTEAKEIVSRNRAGESMKALARETGVCMPTIRDTIRRLGHEPHRGRSGQPPTPLPIAVRDEIIRRYAAGESQQSIAAGTGVSQSRVSRVLGRPGNRKGPASSNWKGGRVGLGPYVAVWVADDDPMAVMRNSQGYVAEHRLVVARGIGRPLLSSETVHHINGDKVDNRLGNLQLRQGRHGKNEVHACGDCGSRNIIAVTLD